jgi:hypothetical protein
MRGRAAKGKRGEPRARGHVAFPLTYTPEIRMFRTSALATAAALALAAPAYTNPQ